MTHNRRSHAMDGLKLLFMLLIVVHHSGFYEEILHHGYMAVDLFFMISGYFLQYTLENKPQMGVGGYFLSRIGKLYPHYLLSFAVMFLSTTVYRVGSISLSMLLRYLPEILLVQNLGIVSGSVNYPCWYLSVLVFAGVIVFFLGRKLPQKWFNVLGGTCTLVVYGFILRFTGGSMETFAKVGVFYLPFWRGMAGLFCGTFLFQLHKSLQPVFHEYAAGFRALELASLVGVIALMCSTGMTDAPILICIFSLLLCVGNEMSVLEHFFDCTAAMVAIRYEYAVFLNHAFIIGMVKKLFVDTFGFPDLVNLLVLLIALTFYSVITNTLVCNGMQLFSKAGKKVKA